MFWLRRLVVLAVVAGVAVAGIVVATSLLSGSDGSASAARKAPGAAPIVPGPSPSGAAVAAPAPVAPTPTPTPTMSGLVGPCTGADVALTATPGHISYAWNGKVTFTVTVRNAGSGPCVLDASDTSRAVVVSSGGTPVWTSARCASGQRMLLLGPGDVDTRTVVWNRTRSAATCGGKQAAVRPGDYTVTTQLLGTSSTPATFTLLAKPSPQPTGTPTNGTGGATPPAGTTPTTAPTTPSTKPTAPSTKATAPSTKAAAQQPATKGTTKQPGGTPGARASASASPTRTSSFD